MAVTKKQNKQPKGHNLVAAIVAQVEELMRKHVGAILEFVDESEDKKEKVTFGVDVNCSESEPLVKVGIRYSQSVTDSRSVTLDDPDQGTFAPVVKQAEEETKKVKSKKGKSLEPEEADTLAE